jgi:thioredoxin reductase (NADPH)
LSVCDGYEVTYQRIGVLGGGKDAASKAKFLRTYSKDVTLLSLEGQPAADEETANFLSEAGIKVAGPVSAIERCETEIRTVIARQSETYEVIYPALGCSVRSELALELGARRNDVGCLEVDAHQQTTVQGIYAAGDVVSDLHQIAVATGHAAIAATHIHKSLQVMLSPQRKSRLFLGPSHDKIRLSSGKKWRITGDDQGSPEPATASLHNVA